MKVIYATFLILLATALITSIRAAEQSNPKPKKLTDEQLWDIYYKFIADVKPYGLPTEREKHKQKIKPVLEHVDRGFETVMCMSYAHISSSETIWVDIDEYTGEIRYYMLTYDFGPRNGREGKVKPIMTKEEAIEKARSYLFLNTCLELTNYTTIASNTGSTWRVYFYRKLGDYVFRNDLVAVNFSEKYGLLYYRNGLFSDECDIKAKITEKQAEELAVKYIRELENKRRCLKHPVKIEKGTVLKIINPTYLKVKPSIYKASMKELRKTRLAWILLYMEVEFDGLPNGIMLFIDAITGDLLIHWYVLP